MISLTTKAKEKLIEISDEEGVSPSIRVKAKGGGCNGFIFDIAFEEAISDIDEVFDIDGIKVIIDPLSLEYFEGLEIDYKTSDFDAGFIFNAPLARSNCGCGKSVAF